MANMRIGQSSTCTVSHADSSLKLVFILKSVVVSTSMFRFSWRRRRVWGAVH